MSKHDNLPRQLLVSVPGRMPVNVYLNADDDDRNLHYIYREAHRPAQGVEVRVRKS